MSMPRIFSPTLWIGALLLSASLGLTTASPAEAASLSTSPAKPNVLLVLTDDIGMDQLQTYGYGGLTAPATPNLQSISAAGLTFRNAWTMPACSTARGVLYTGRYPFRTNLLAALGPDDLANSMISPYENTLPKVMKKAGYTTALFGKFHVGLQGNNPYGLGMVNALGWDEYNGWLDQTGDPSSIDTTAGGVGATGQYPLGYVPGSRNGGADSGACYAAAGGCKIMSSDRLSKNPAGRACRDSGGIFVPKSACSKNGGNSLAFSNLSAHYVSPLVINGKAIPYTDVRARTFRNIQQTDAAIAWIKQQQTSRKPWFATISTATVHTPMQPPPVSTLPSDAPDSNGVDPSSAPGRILIANQMIQAMDYEMGRLFTSIGIATKKNGKLVLTATASNTVVIYVNDNGSLGSQVRQPFDPQRSKGTPYQTGVWTPMIVAGPIVKTPGQETAGMVNIADLYELIGTIAGEDVRRNNPRRVDSVPMLPYFTNINKPSIRKFDFTMVGPNIQANGSMNGPCQFANSCSQIPVTKSVCEDNGGVWFGAQATGSYNNVPIPTDGFTYCCQVQVWVKDNGGTPVSVQPETGVGVRDDSGFKLVRNQMNDYDTDTNSCVEKTYNELYVVTQGKPPLLDREDLMIPEPYTQVQQQKFDQLTAYMNQVLASDPECTGDGNDDGIVNVEDLWNFDKMRLLTSGSSWYDINEDGVTNTADRQLILQNLGHICK
ncbi:sulfatase-like hydrolase/transferase [Aestuariivirga sp.]|uniref:sulfatase-like hydrolase/transferase n=1 Tax=Aestuariivirga sp. TaxID=2650926 RepID=UPI003BA8AE70